MNEKVRIIISHDPSYTFLFVLELAVGYDASGVSEVPTSYGGSDLFRSVHEREVKYRGCF